jgi:hypothetical protein
MIGAGKKEWSPQGNEKPAHNRHSAGNCLLTLAALPDDAVPAFNARASAGMATVQPDRIGAGFRRSEKKCSASLHSVSICASRSKELTRSNWIIWLAPEPFSGGREGRRYGREIP